MKNFNVLRFAISTLVTTAICYPLINALFPQTPISLPSAIFWAGLGALIGQVINKDETGDKE